MKVWILNHYATDMYFDGAGRHQSFAKYLKKGGHDIKIFCASTVHNSDINVDTNGEMSIELIGQDDVPYVMVKTSSYVGNGTQRIKNMIGFYLKVFGVMKSEIRKNGKPDVILASSVHPLTLVAGIQFAKKIKCPCICEVRDLWPETFLDFGFKKGNIILKILYTLERWIYAKADMLIFTMEGGKDYILEKNWQNKVDLAKIHYINNGVDLDMYLSEKEENIVYDDDLNLDDFKVVYTGSIREANGVENIVQCAEKLINEKIKFIVYGDGPDRVKLERYCQEKRLKNITFKGKVSKKCVPYILSKGDLLLLNYKQCDIDRFGTSQNKLFEYLASGKPILSNAKMGYDIIKKYGCGISRAFQNADEYAECVLEIKRKSKSEYEELCLSAEKAAKDFDFKNLSKDLEKVLFDAVNSKKE